MVEDFLTSRDSCRNMQSANLHLWRHRFRTEVALISTFRWCYMDCSVGCKRANELKRRGRGWGEAMATNFKATEMWRTRERLGYLCRMQLRSLNFTRATVVILYFLDMWSTWANHFLCKVYNSTTLLLIYLTTLLFGWITQRPIVGCFLHNEIE